MLLGLDPVHLQLDGIVIQTVAIIVTACGVGFTVFWNLKIAKRRATLDILLQGQSTEPLISNRTRFTALRDAGALEQWADPDKVNTEDAEIVRSVMGRYELISLGVHKGALDRAIYKRWTRTTLVRDYIALRPLIERIRAGTGVRTFYKEFEDLAWQWADAVERPFVKGSRQADRAGESA